MKYLVATISLFLLYGIMVGFWKGFISLFGNEELLIPLIIGIILGTLFSFTLVKKYSQIATFEHELTHAIVALLFFRKITKFVVTGHDGGYVRHHGGFGGDFGDLNITLSPYFLPTFTFLLVFIRPFLPLEYLFFYDIFLGFTLGYHFFSTLNELRRNWHQKHFQQALSYKMTQSDIGKSGYVFSIIYILTMTLLIHGGIFWMFTNSFSGLNTYLDIIISRTGIQLSFFSELYMEYFNFIAD